MACLLTACHGRSPKEAAGNGGDQKLVIREITAFLEKSTYHRSPSFFDEDAGEFFSTDLLQTFNAAMEDEDAFLDMDPWAENQDPDPKTHTEVTDVYDIEDETATADVTVFQWKMPLRKTVYLKYEDEGWRIDNFTIGEEGSTVRDMLLWPEN